MRPRRAVYLTARREVLERVRSRAFLVSTAIQLAIVVAIVIIAGLTGGDETDSFDVGYAGTQAERVVDAARAQQDSFNAELTTHPYADDAAARAAVDGDDVDAAVADGTLIVRANTSDTLSALLQAGQRATVSTEELRRQGLDDAEVQRALDPPALTVAEVGEGSAGSGIAFIGSLLLYIAILTFGILVATAVVTEKSTRVVEVVLSAIRPVQLLAGKVLGIGLIGLGQITLIAGVGAIVAAATGGIDLPSTTAEAVILVIVCFVLGYLMYASAYAVAGAIVSRQEDVQSSSAPLSILLIAGYLVAISISDSPDSGLATFGTLFPPLAPMVVPGRAAQDALPAWESSSRSC